MYLFLLFIFFVIPSKATLYSGDIFERIEKAKKLSQYQEISALIKFPNLLTEYTNLKSKQDLINFLKGKGLKFEPWDDYFNNKLSPLIKDHEKLHEFISKYENKDKNKDKAKELNSQLLNLAVFAKVNDITVLFLKLVSLYVKEFSFMKKEIEALNAMNGFCQEKKCEESDSDRINNLLKNRMETNKNYSELWGAEPEKFYDLLQKDIDVMFITNEKYKNRLDLWGVKPLGQKILDLTKPATK